MGWNFVRINHLFHDCCRRHGAIYRGTTPIHGSGGHEYEPQQSLPSSTLIFRPVFRVESSHKDSKMTHSTQLNRHQSLFSDVTSYHLFRLVVAFRKLVDINFKRNLLPFEQTNYTTNEIIIHSLTFGYFGFEPKYYIKGLFRRSVSATSCPWRRHGSLAGLPNRR